MDTIGKRIKYIRKDLKHLTLEQFGQRIGITASSCSTIESGKNNPSEQTIRLICSEFGVDEVWLRTGVGKPFAPKAREQELNEFIKSLFYDRPESFRSRLLTTLLRFDPNGAEWEVLERIYDSVAAEVDTYRQEKEESDL